jgi:hypothetical protein
MPIQHAVWTVADTPVEVPQGVCRPSSGSRT